MPTRQQKPFLAFDLGAESGRAVLGRVHAGIITTEEVHRFCNQAVEYGGSLHWDAPRLWFEMRKALSSLQQIQLSGIGVDTWGVDYALLGERGELLQNPFHYRDKRTDGVMEQVFQKVTKDEIYSQTGIQFMPINTLYQLYAAKQATPELLTSARSLLTMPDLFHYWLTGNAVCEFTNATTTQLVNAVSRSWSKELMDKLQIPSDLPAQIVEPGSLVGALCDQAASSRNLAGTPVIAPGSHDTASAVAAVAACDGTAFLSSGTWSLLGTELNAPVINAESMRLNFTNEGGVCGTTRFLKNVMGLWMLQCCRKFWSAQGTAYSYAELMEMSFHEPAFKHFVDPNNECFLHPTNMPEAISKFCERTQQPKPGNPGAYVRAVLESLALKYAVVTSEIEQLTGTPIRQIRIIGGGSKNRVLNQFTADATGRKVLAGPVEATALGNIAMQMLATGEVSSLAEARALIDRSFPTEVFEPRESDRWQDELERFQHYTGMVYA
jgi:rhamnulokinase